MATPEQASAYLAALGGAPACPLPVPAAPACPLPVPACPRKLGWSGWGAGSAAALRNPLAWLIAVAVIFVIVLAILFMLQPSFVTSVNSNGDVVLDRQKLFCWALGFTIIFIAIVWVFAGGF